MSMVLAVFRFYFKQVTKIPINTGLYEFEYGTYGCLRKNPFQTEYSLSIAHFLESMNCFTIL